MKLDESKEVPVGLDLADAEYRAARNEFWFLERIREAEITGYPEDDSYWKLDKTRIISLRKNTLFTGKGAPSPQTQFKILFTLEARGVIGFSLGPVIEDGKEKTYVNIEVLHPAFDKYYEQRKAEMAKLQNSVDVATGKSSKSQKNYPKSIHLVADTLAANNDIFFVLDEQYKMPIRFDAKNKNRKDSPMKKLYNIAYFIDVAGKKITHDDETADSINNWPFKRKKIADYMRTNKLTKPTLVQKSSKGSFVLKNDTPVTTILYSAVPSQHRSLYIDKTQY